MWKRIAAIALLVMLLCSLTGMLEVAATEDYRGWSQSDSRWGSLIMGDDKAATVADYGCASVSITKIMRQCGAVGAGYTPKDFVNHMNKIGNYVLLPSNNSGSIKSWSNAMKAGKGLSYEGEKSYASDAQILNYVKQGDYVIVKGTTKYGTHYCPVDNEMTLTNGYVTIMNSWATPKNNINIKWSKVFSKLSQIYLFKMESVIEYEQMVNGQYYLKNVHTGTYVSVDGGKDNNKQNVSVADYTGGKEQQMNLVYGEKGCKIRPACSSSKLLNPYADTVRDGTNVNIYNPSNDKTQLWGFEKVKEGYVIRNMSNPACVLSVNGSNVVVSAYSGDKKQIWTLEKVENDVQTHNPFQDVVENQYYYKPVQWAIENKITSGLTASSFGVGQACTREQIVTFLWNYAGRPEAVQTICAFTDVNPSHYYYKAMLWAVEKKITSGLSSDIFGVGRPCTREQIVTFLWNYAGQPAAAKKDCAFTDVNEGHYYYKAMLWAVESGIVAGYNDHIFGTGDACTREQIVTFLYRYDAI